VRAPPGFVGPIDGAREDARKEKQRMSIYTISDPDTKFCAAAMRQCGGRWNGVRNVWMFGSIADAADAALELYRATRATIAMREEIQSMIDDGTAVAAWSYDETTPIDLDGLSFAEAKSMLAAGRQVRRLLGVHPLEDLPADPSEEDAASVELREQAFEARARRNRKGRGRRAA
jgi:hypothetical protein